MLTRAHQNDVNQIICIGTSHLDSVAAHEFAANNQGVYWTYGLHPSEAKSTQETSSLKIELPPNQKSKLVAIGEIGLDYHYEGYDKKAQIALFERLLQLADDDDLPVSFHVRQAFEDFFAIIRNFPKIRGVVHSFTDSKKVLKRIVNETDFYVGVNGLATYSTLPTPPLERIILETDSPFLAPSPHRGEINEPAHIKEIAEWLASKLNQDVEAVAKITTKNAKDLFHI